MCQARIINIIISSDLCEIYYMYSISEVTETIDDTDSPVAVYLAITRHTGSYKRIIMIHV